MLPADRCSRALRLRSSKQHTSLSSICSKLAYQALVAISRHLEIYVMCEIANNVLLIDEFSQIFDGFSIGSNDLTQLTLGVDRDSAMVAFDFDERDPGVKKMIALAVEGCRRNQRHSGLCGQAPSDFPEFAGYLVRLGIDSISLNPDVVVKTTALVLAAEARFPLTGNPALPTVPTAA